MDRKILDLDTLQKMDRLKGGLIISLVSEGQILPCCCGFLSQALV